MVKKYFFRWVVGLSVGAMMVGSLGASDGSPRRLPFVGNSAASVFTTQTLVTALLNFNRKPLLRRSPNVRARVIREASTPTHRPTVGATVPAITSVAETELRQALPTDVSPKTVDFILSRFGEYWSDALSLMGAELLQSDRWAFIDRALGQRIPLIVLADFLYYRDHGIVIEDFPPELVSTMLKNYRLKGVNNGLHRWVLTAFAVLWLRYRSPAIELDSLVKRMVDVAFRQRQIGDALNAAGNHAGPLSDRALVRFARATYVSSRNDARLNMPQELKDRKILNGSLSDWLADGYHVAMHVGHLRLRTGEEGLNVYLTQAPVAYPGDDQHLLLGTVVFRWENHGADLIITMLQSWSHQAIGILTPAMIEKGVEQSLRHYALSMNVERMVTPAGHHLFSNVIAPVHRHTIERLNTFYRKAGYRLVYRKHNWWWEHELSTVPHSALSRLASTAG